VFVSESIGMWCRIPTHENPWHRAAESTRDHRRAERGLLGTKFFHNDLFHRFVNAKVETGSDCVSQGMQVITGIETEETVSIDDPLNAWKVQSVACYAG